MNRDSIRVPSGSETPGIPALSRTNWSTDDEFGRRMNRLERANAWLDTRFANLFSSYGSLIIFGSLIGAGGCFVAAVFHKLTHLGLGQ